MAHQAVAAVPTTRTLLLQRVLVLRVRATPAAWVQPIRPIPCVAAVVVVARAVQVNRFQQPNRTAVMAVLAFNTTLPALPFGMRVAVVAVVLPQLPRLVEVAWAEMVAPLTLWALQVPPTQVAVVVAVAILAQAPTPEVRVARVW